MIIILSGLFLVIGAYFAFKTTRNILSPVFIIIGILVFNYIGGLIIYFANGHIKTPLFISIGVLFYGLGAIFIATCLHFKPAQELSGFRGRPFFSVFPNKRAFFASLVIVFLITVSLTAYYFIIVGIPVFSKDVPAFRLTEAEGRGIFIRAGDTFLPVIVLIAYVFNKTRKRLETKGFLFIVAIVGLVYIFFTGIRGLAIIYILPFIMLYGLICRKINWKLMTAGMLIFLAAAIGFQDRYLGWEDLPLRDAVLLLGRRMTTVQAMGVDYIVYDIVPQSGFFMGGIAWNEFNGILATIRIIPDFPKSFPVTVFEIMHGVDPKVRFAMATTSIGDLYVDFGVPGIVLGMFLLGVISQMLYIKTLRYCKDYFILPVMVYLQYLLVMTHHSRNFFNIFGFYGISLLVVTVAILSLQLILSLPLGRVIIRLPKKMNFKAYSKHKIR